MMADGAVSIPVASGMALRPGMGEREGWLADFVAQGAFGGSVSRASGGYVFNTTGVMVNVAANGFRFDVKPNTLSARGLLVEESRTNALLQARTYSTTWANGGAGTLTFTTGFAGLFGDNGATRLTADATAKRIEQTITVTASTTQYVYALVKPETSTAPYLRVDNNAVVYQVTFDLVAMTKTDANSNCTTETIIPLSNGFYLVGFAYTPTGTSSIVRFYPGVGSVVLDGVQHEVGSAPSSFIHTTTAAATRAYDSVGMVDLTALGVNLSAFTCVVEWEYNGILANTGYVMSLSDGTFNNYMALRPNSGATLHGGVVVNGGTAVATLYDSLGAAGIQKQAFAVKGNDFAYCINGGAVTTDTSGALPVVDRMYVGAGPAGTGQFLNGWVRKVTVYNGRLPDAQLQALTV